MAQVVPSDPERNAGDRRMALPDAADIPEAQEDFGQTGDPADPIADALKTLAEFAAAQEAQGNPGIKQGLVAFMNTMTGLNTGGAEGIMGATEESAEAIETPEGGAVEDAEGGAVEEGMAPPGRGPLFDPTKPPEEDEEDDEEVERKKKKKKPDQTIVNA